MRFGRCRRETVLIRDAGAGSKRSSRRSGYVWAAPKLKISKAGREEGRRGVWQPRYWEHTLEDEDDFERHFDYIHYNPVKHGYVKCPRDWPWSSFHRWVEADVYPRNWACSTAGFALDFSDIEDRVGEPE